DRHGAVAGILAAGVCRLEDKSFAARLANVVHGYRKLGITTVQLVGAAPLKERHRADFQVDRIVGPEVPADLARRQLLPFPMLLLESLYAAGRYDGDCFIICFAAFLELDGQQVGKLLLGSDPVLAVHVGGYEHDNFAGLPALTSERPERPW